MPVPDFVDLTSERVVIDLTEEDENEIVDPRNAVGVQVHPPTTSSMRKAGANPELFRPTYKDLTTRSRPSHLSNPNGQPPRRFPGPLSRQSDTAGRAAPSSSPPSQNPNSISFARGNQVPRSPQESPPSRSTTRSNARQAPIARSDDNGLLKEQTGSIPDSPAYLSHNGKRLRSESVNSSSAASRASMRLRSKENGTQESSEDSMPATRRESRQNLRARHQQPSEYEVPSHAASDPQYRPDEPVPEPPDMAKKSFTLHLYSKQIIYPEMFELQNLWPEGSSTMQTQQRPKHPPPPPPLVDETHDADASPEMRSKRSSRSRGGSQRSVSDSLGTASPIGRHVQEKGLRFAKAMTNRNESSRVMTTRGSLSHATEKQAYTVSEMIESLHSHEQDMKAVHALTARYLLHEAREDNLTRPPLPVDEIDFFAPLQSVQHQPKDPIPKGVYSVDLWSSTHKGGKNINGKGPKVQTKIFGKREKPNVSRVPVYSSHTFVQRNMLSADDEKLRFVPFLGDAEHNESGDRCLDNDLEEAYSGRRAESSRFAELYSILKSHLGIWLRDPRYGCTVETLERFVLTLDDEMEGVGPGPESRAILLESFGAGLSNEEIVASRRFLHAFHKVFEVSLAKVLLPPERFKELIEAAKEKGQKNVNASTNSLAVHLETYAKLRCLICGAIECLTHGFYERVSAKEIIDGQVQHDKIQIAIPEPEHLIRRHEERLARKSPPPFPDERRPEEPCGENCFMSRDIHGDNWGLPKKTKDDLRNLLFGWEEGVGRSCELSLALGVPCWQIKEEIDKIESEKGGNLRRPEKLATGRVRRLDWYDNKRKTLRWDFERDTSAHLHDSRTQISPCSHPGRSCDNDCICTINNVLCERMCGCSDDCPRKFTGCACHMNGRSCISDTCICVQMNRECGPQCQSCGAVPRLDPKNRYDDALFQTGCQNIALSRGVPKALIMGESQLEGTGYGLYAAERIRKGEFVSEYRGEIISSAEADRRGIIYDRKYLSFLFDLNYEWAVDAGRLGNKTRFINHADSVQDGLNCEAKILFVNGEHRIKFLALRDISEGEELFFDYGKKFAEKHGLSKKLPKIKEGAKKGVVMDDALDALDGVDTRTRNSRGNYRGTRGGRGGRGRGKASKSAPNRLAVREALGEEEDVEMPDVVNDQDDDEDEYETDEEAEERSQRPRRNTRMPGRYTR